MRTASTATAFFAFLMLFLPVLAHAQDVLSGQYYGVNEAKGASIKIAPDAEGFTGVFYDPAGKSQAFEADRVENAAEAVLDMGGETVLLRVVPKPFGAEVGLIPFNKDGSLVFETSRLLTFVREGLELPETPPDYVDPPKPAVRRISANSFLASYEFWPPNGVRDGYLKLAPRFRTMMALFPAVQLDVIFKLCLASQADAALSQALRGQGVTCSEVVDGMAKAQRNGSFVRYKEEVGAQLATLRMAVKCGDSYVLTKEECDAAGKAVSKQAVSLETAATVLQRYR
ncbi:hypothetical protein KHP62_04255 [Rhodobacteraceae bacterium NNCM2]|nr:hypothetical protein [Coraliihabitans acroporae]